jgi:hypothetical protein
LHELILDVRRRVAGSGKSGNAAARSFASGACGEVGGRPRGDVDVGRPDRRPAVPRQDPDARCSQSDALVQAALEGRCGIADAADGFLPLLV